MKKIIVIFFAILLFLPLGWMFIGSFQPSAKLNNSILFFRFKDITLENYYMMLTFPIIRWFFNSVIVALSTTVIAVIVNITAGYAFAKKRFKGKEILFSLFLFTMVIPSQITLIPSFLLIRWFGLYNTLLGMILPGGVSAFMIYFFRQYLEGIPDEFLDMATIDGCGEMQRFLKIIIPLSSPAIITMILIQFIGVWSAFLWQMIIVNRVELYTLPVGITVMLLSEAMNKFDLPNYGLTFAAAIFAFLPILALFLAGQKYYMKGLFSGGLKE